ncbi:MAG: ABC transporter ATP-binding protein, partial [Haliea sp.]|nr:ABC transporter ATP-binding protein [Haliea sp.]
NHGEIVENSSMRDLLRRVQREVFIFDTVDELPEVVTVGGFEVRRVDDRTLEIEVEKGQHINEVFAGLNQANIRISSMRNRANRLEEMFVRLVEGAA